MFRIVIQWLLSAILLMIMMRLIPGFFAENLNSALMVAIGIGLANGLLGYSFKMITFPLAIALFALLLVGINVGLIELASQYVDGFFVYSIDPALWAAGVLAGLSVLLRMVMKTE